MTAHSVVHGSFTLSRNWPHVPAKVFRAFSDRAAKDQWFGRSPDLTPLTREFDFRVGGKEHMSGRWNTGIVSRFDCIYHDIVDNARIVYSYTMHLDARKISVSQACIEFRPDGAGTKLVLREDGIFLDGYDDNGSREHGTNFLIDALGKSLEAV